MDFEPLWVALAVLDEANQIGVADLIALLLHEIHGEKQHSHAEDGEIPENIVAAAIGIASGLTVASSVRLEPNAVLASSPIRPAKGRLSGLSVLEVARRVASPAM